MRRFVFRLILFFTLLLVIGAGVAWFQMQRYLDTPLPLQAEQAYELKPGANFIRVLNELKRAGVLDETRTLRWYGRLSGEARQIKAGEYVIPAGTTPRQLLAMFVAGKVRQYALTLVEGWNFGQVMEAVNRHPALQHTLKGLDNASIMARL